MSIKLKIFLLSNDYVRNYYLTNGFDYNKTQDLVKSTNEKRMKILIDKGFYLVFDMNFNDESCFEKTKGYNVIKIKLSSSDDDNINSIIKRNYEPQNIINGVLGDNVKFESPYDKDTYYEIKARKKIELDDSNSDYVIKEDDLLEDKINEIVNEIEKRFS